MNLESRGDPVVVCRAVVFYGLKTFIPLYWIRVYSSAKAAG